MQVLDYFREIAAIPHGSGNEKRLSDYLVEFAKKLNLSVIQDEALNIIIKKPASSGYEKAPAVIIQGHLDMVCEKNNDTVHDFLNDPLELVIKDGYLQAAGTTLGADDGVAVAMAMAILADASLAHPRLEILLTTGEETSMLGAKALDPELLQGRIMINLDSEEEGVFCTSCAGGFRTTMKLKLSHSSPLPGQKAYSVQITGLMGGHSGSDIQLGRANANKLLGTLLYNIPEPYRLFGLTGGMKDNAVPREARALLVTALEKEKLSELCAYWQKVWRDKFGSLDPEITVILTEEEMPDEVWTSEVTKQAVNCLMLMPNGIKSMSPFIDGLVQSSTNLGVVKQEGDYLVLHNLSRSSLEPLKKEMAAEMQLVAELTGMELMTGGDYPAWSYDPDSHVRQLAVKAYTDINGQKPVLTATHAGLECGLFAEKFGAIDLISFGPQMHDVHTPAERLNLASLERTYKFLVHLLSLLK